MTDASSTPAITDMPDITDRVVSSDSEELILVDDHDREIGFATKGHCHDAEGVLHRAFSVFVFNSRGEVLLQQRSATKRLWPLYWANTCCSHPRRGETMEVATQRRMEQEVGFSCDVEFLYKFEYHATFDNLGSEHELCWVYAGVCDPVVRPNRQEVAASRWVTVAQIERELRDTPEHFTPWFKLEWAQLRECYPLVRDARRD